MPQRTGQGSVLITRAHKTEIAPTVRQRKVLELHGHVARKLYNWALLLWRQEYLAGRKPDAFKIHKSIVARRRLLRGSLPDVSSYVVRDAVLDLGQAYSYAFARLKEGKKGRVVGWPKLKRFHGPLRFHNQQGSTIRVREDAISMPTLGVIKLRRRGYIPTSGVKICAASVSKYAGRWFVSVIVSYEEVVPAVKDGSILGVDAGVRALATVSDGTSYSGKDRLEAIKRCEKQLRLWSRRMSRRAHAVTDSDGVILPMKSKTAGFLEARERVAKYQARLANLRKDMVHKTTRLIADKEVSTLVIETLNLSNMVKNRRLARPIASAGMGEMHRQLGYKVPWRGGEIVKAPLFFGSSKRCSACGSYVDRLGSKRTFSCPKCGATKDRDANAASNLEQYGQRPEIFDAEISQRQARPRTAGEKPPTARGASVAGNGKASSRKTNRKIGRSTGVVDRADSPGTGKRASEPVSDGKRTAQSVTQPHGERCSSNTEPPLGSALSLVAVH